MHQPTTTSSVIGGNEWHWRGQHDSITEDRGKRLMTMDDVEVSLGERPTNSNRSERIERDWRHRAIGRNGNDSPTVDE